MLPLYSVRKAELIIYFDFNNAFDIVAHALLLHKLDNCALSSGYLNWFIGYLSNRQSCVRFSGIILLPFVLLSGVPQESVLRALPFSILINDLRDVINHSNGLLLLVTLKSVGLLVCLVIVYFLLLQPEIFCVHKRFSANFMKPNFTKISVVSCMKKRSVLIINTGLEFL
jgi:hypothetical protein